MKNPRWKSGGILNIICGWFYTTHGKLMLKYKYHNDFQAFRLTQKYYGPKPKNFHKVTYENIRKNKNGLR